jgi:hypothetical protein
MLMAVAFVLPDRTLLPKPDLASSAKRVTGTNNFPRFLEVLSPPPRLTINA